jgi:hypothetical protein
MNPSGQGWTEVQLPIIFFLALGSTQNIFFVLQLKNSRRHAESQADSPMVAFFWPEITGFFGHTRKNAQV